MTGIKSEFLIFSGFFWFNPAKWGGLRIASIVTLGLDYAEYLKFKHITGHLRFFHHFKKPYYFSGQKKDPSRSDAEFTVAFAIGSVLMIEEKVGNIGQTVW